MYRVHNISDMRTILYSGTARACPFTYGGIFIRTEEIAKGDIDGDGLDDLLVGATNIEPTQVYLRRGNRFERAQYPGLTEITSLMVSLSPTRRVSDPSSRAGTVLPLNPEFTVISALLRVSTVKGAPPKVVTRSSSTCTLNKGTSPVFST